MPFPSSGFSFSFLHYTRIPFTTAPGLLLWRSLGIAWWRGQFDELDVDTTMNALMPVQLEAYCVASGSVLCCMDLYFIIYLHVPSYQSLPPMLFNSFIRSRPLLAFMVRLCPPSWPWLVRSALYCRHYQPLIKDGPECS